MPTAKQICDSIRDRSLLDFTVEDIHLDHLAKEMTEWREIAPKLDITPAEEEEIAEKHRGHLRLQKREALRKWKEKQGAAASYRRLITIFCAEGKVDLAESIKRILTTERSPPSDQTASPTDVIDDFRGYLINDCYIDLPDQPPSSLPWPNSFDNLGYVELDLFDVPVSDGPGNVKRHKHIELSSLFTVGNTKAKRKVILIEGVAGAGKTTLSWYACKEWVAGKLFKDIKLLIHVSLSDPVIHSAAKLADIIPHHSERVRATVADAIINTRGQEVCFWLDACDEAPPSLWESFLYQFVAGSGSGRRATLSNVNIILTSRPQITVKLTTILTGKVIVKGFQSLQQFVTACLPDNGDQLLEALDLKPELYSLCHLPLNAAILVYLYDTFKDDLPTTRTGLFRPLISNFVVRHMLTRTSYTHADVTDFPANLPDDICSSFAKVTKLAYTSIIQRKTIMGRNTLTECGISSVIDAFGFIVVRLRFTICGPTDQFSFIHSSLQEFLAAFYISEMCENQQIRAIHSVLDQNPNSPVLAFFAGLNRLVVKEIRQMYLKVLINPCGITDIVKDLQLAEGYSKVNPADDPRRRLLSLMNSLYETQNPALFSLVTLNDSDVLDMVLVRPACKEIFMTFSFIYLYPTDCLSLGYFLRHVYVKEKSNINWVNLDLSCALIGDREIRALAQELGKPARSCILYLNICGVPISSNSLHCLKALFHSESCLLRLEFDSRFISDMYLAMKYIIEGLSRSHCRQLMMGCCSSKIIHYLILLLYQPVHVLDLSYSHNLFTPPRAMQMFCEVMKYSQLKQLMLNACGINDGSLKLLASTICHEESCILERLEIGFNPYTDYGLTHFLRLMVESPFVPIHLIIMSVNSLNDEHLKHIHEINSFRKCQNRPKLAVRCVFEQYLQNKQYQDRRIGYNLLKRPDLAFQPPHH